MRVALICSEPVDYTIAWASGLAPHAEVTALLPRARYAGLREWIDPRVDLELVDWPRTRSLANPAFMWDLTHRLRAIDPDVVHLLSNTTLWLNGAAPFWRRWPLVTTIHDVTEHPGDRDTAQLPGWGSRLMARQSDHLIVHGAGLRSAASAAFRKAPERVHVFHHPAIRRYAELARRRGLKRGTPAETFTVLLFGRIFTYKGLETLVRAEALLKGDLPEIRFVVAGRGDDPMTLRPQMGDPCRYDIRHGFVEDAEVAQLFTDADLVVLPYEEASQSGVLHVAAPFGKPVLVTDVGELGPTVRAAGIGRVVPPRDPQALAQAIRELATDACARHELGRNALLWSEGEDAPSTIGEAATALYRRIATERAGASPK